MSWLMSVREMNEVKKSELPHRRVESGFSPTIFHTFSDSRGKAKISVVLFSAQSSGVRRVAS